MLKFVTHMGNPIVRSSSSLKTQLRRLQCRVHYYVADGTVLSCLPGDCAPASRRPEAITIPQQSLC